MAGDEKPKTYQEIDIEAIEKYNRILAERHNRLKMMQKYNDWRGNKVPPFSIQHLPQERQRLATPMTAEDRILRKQWIQDQKLGANEPRFIPELHQVNIFRRIYRKPLDLLWYKVLEPKIGHTAAFNGRWLFPKVVAMYLAIYLGWYHLKYSHNDWTRVGGWHWYTNRPIVFPGEEIPEGYNKDDDDFGDKGFKARTSHQDI